MNKNSWRWCGKHPNHFIAEKTVDLQMGKSHPRNFKKILACPLCLQFWNLEVKALIALTEKFNKPRKRAVHLPDT